MARTKKQSVKTKIKQPKTLTAQKVWEEIYRYNPFMECTTILTMKTLATNQSSAIFSHGGMGKGRSTDELINEMLGFKNVYSCDGVVTPRAFFEVLRNNENKIIVFKEASIFRDPKIVDMSKLALEGDGEISWKRYDRESSEEYPDEEDMMNTISFRGAFIITGNYLQESNDTRAFLSRFDNVTATMSKEQLKEKFKIKRKYKPNQAVWKHLKMKVLSYKDEALTKRQEDFIYDKIYEYIDILGNNGVSMRTDTKLINFYKFLIHLFGDEFATRKAPEMFAHLLKEPDPKLIKADVMPALAIAFDKIFAQSKTTKYHVEYFKIVRAIMQATGFKKSKAYGIIRDSVDKGLFSQTDKKSWLEINCKDRDAFNEAVSLAIPMI